MSIWQIPLAITWSGASGSPGTNTWAYRVPTTVSDVDGVLEQATTDLGAFHQAIKTIYNSNVTVSTDGVWTGLGDDQGDSHDVAGFSVAGTGTSGFAPPSQCIILDRKASTGGRSGRGRVFLGPLSSSMVESNGTPVEDARAYVLAAANDLLSPGPLDGAFCIWSRTDQVARDITSFSVPNIFGSLRSRRD